MPRAVGRPSSREILPRLKKCSSASKPSGNEKKNLFFLTHKFDSCEYVVIRTGSADPADEPELRPGVAEPHDAVADQDGGAAVEAGGLFWKMKNIRRCEIYVNYSKGGLFQEKKPLCCLLAETKLTTFLTLTSTES